MKLPLTLGLIGLGLFSLAGHAAESDTRGGTCDDTRKQVDYYCNGQGDPNDIFTQANIACNNAKRNMAAACEGKPEKDHEYTFEKK